MADLVITAANVVQGSNANTINGILGETVTAGQTLYLNSTTGKWMKADSNSVTAEAKIPIGIALNGGALNQPVSVLRSGDITIGATMTAGIGYWLSDTPGGICPLADVGTGEDVVQIGISQSTTILRVNIAVSGYTIP